MIRTYLDELSLLGRTTHGVRVMRMDEGELVVAVARLVDSDDNSAELASPPEPRE